MKTLKRAVSAPAALMAFLLALAPGLAPAQASPWIVRGAFDDAAAFNDTAASPDGLYAVGYLGAALTMTLPGGISVSAPYRGDNALAVRFKPDGTVAWARTLASAKASTVFLCAAAVPGGLYAVARCRDPGDYDFGDGAIASVKAEFSSVLVKYGADGKTLWAKALSDRQLVINDMAADGSGLYLAGQFSGALPGPGGSLLNAAGKGPSACVLRLDASGSLVWAAKMDAPALAMYFDGLALQGDRVYACGTARGSGSLSLPEGKALDLSTGGRNVGILACLDAATGSTRWLAAPSMATCNTSFLKVAANEGVVAVTGGLNQGGIVLDGGVALSTSAKSAGYLLRFSPEGKALSGFVLEGKYASSGSSELSGLCAAGKGFWVGGLIKNNDSYGLPGGLQATVENYQWTGIAFRLDAAGQADRVLMADKSAPGSSSVNAFSVLPSGALFLVGGTWGAGSFSFGPGLVVEGKHSKASPFALLYLP